MDQCHVLNIGHYTICLNNSCGHMYLCLCANVNMYLHNKCGGNNVCCAYVMDYHRNNTVYISIELLLRGLSWVGISSTFLTFWNLKSCLDRVNSVIYFWIF